MLHVGYWIPLTNDIRSDPCVDRVADTEQGHDDIPDVGSEFSSIDASGRLLGLGEKASVKCLQAYESTHSPAFGSELQGIANCKCCKVRFDLGAVDGFTPRSSAKVSF